MDDISLAADLVRDAGTMASEMLSQGLETRYKTSLSDVVSAADHAGEELISARLADSRPDDGLVGEEGARKAGEGRTWYVDPVDGTYNFLSGIPYWCSAVGLVDADGPLVGSGLLSRRRPALAGRSRGCHHAQRRPRADAAEPASFRDLGRDLLSSATSVGSATPICMAIGDCLCRDAANTRISIDRSCWRREQPAGCLPASQSQRLGLVSRRRSCHRCRRGR